MAGERPRSVYGVIYDEDVDRYRNFEVDDEGLYVENTVQFSPKFTRDLYEALKHYYEEVAE